MDLSSKTPLYNAATDDMYDDACDLGQFCMNPCWYMFVKAKKLFSDTNNDDDKEKKKSSKQNTSLWSVRMQPIVYALAVYGSWTIIFSRGYPFFRASQHVASYHLLIGYVVFGLCVSSWITARWTNPGNLTIKTMARFDNYRYDDLLYMSNTICPTLGIRKLARSKYDKYIDKHVPRFDHFCGWINQSVGEENYRFFLLFLSVHTCMCLYGTGVTFTALWGHAHDVEPEASFKVLAVSAVTCDYGLTAVLILMGFMSILLGAFCSFHVFLIYKGMTTNEYVKWKLVYERHAIATKDYNHRHGRPPQRSNQGDDEEAKLVDHPGPLPVNLYNLGFLGNLHEVLYPRSLYPRVDTMHSKKL